MVDGHTILLVLFLTFITLPMWTAYRHHVGVIKMFTWWDVAWLFVYFAVGILVFIKVRPILLAVQ